MHSGDSVTVERDSDFLLVKLFLSSVKAPKISYDVQESYSWESKEALRKLCIGKKVRVETEYAKEIATKQGTNLVMNFASVFLAKNDKNLSVSQLEKGLARTNLQKSGENMSKYLEDLLTAEKKAVDKKLCLHSAKEAPTVIFADLVSNTKQAKEFETMVMKRGD